MLTLYVMAFTVYLMRSWLSFYRALANLHFFQTKRLATVSAHSGETATIMVLIPLYREGALVASLRATLIRLCDNIPAGVMFYLLTSDRESGSISTNTTHDLLQQQVWPKQVRLVNLPGQCTGKGRVLNAFLSSQPSLADDSWIAIYDADSDPEPKIFSYVAALAPDVTIVQQPSLYLRNLGLLGPLLRRLAWYQTFWSLGTETTRLRIYQKLVSAGCLASQLPYFYLVGHGLFIRYRLLRQLGLFHEIYEDLRLGIPAAIAEAKIDVAPFFDTCQFAGGLRIFMRQSMNWCNGSWFIWGDLRLTLRTAARETIAGAWAMTLRGALNNLCWSSEGFMIYAILVLGFFTSSHMQMTVLILGMLAAEGLMLRILQNRYRAISSRMPPDPDSWVKAILTGMLRPLFYSTGALLGTLRCLVFFGPNRSWVTESSPKDSRSAGIRQKEARLR